MEFGSCSPVWCSVGGVSQWPSPVLGILGWASSVLAQGNSDPALAGRLANGVLSLLCGVVATPANRGRLHRWLGRLGGRGSEEEEAAAISALVAGAHPELALANAARMFRCLRASGLERRDLAGSALGVSTSAAELAAKTEPAELGVRRRPEPQTR